MYWLKVPCQLRLSYRELQMMKSPTNLRQLHAMLACSAFLNFCGLLHSDSVSLNSLVVIACNTLLSDMTGGRLVYLVYVSACKGGGQRAASQAHTRSLIHYPPLVPYSKLYVSAHTHTNITNIFVIGHWWHIHIRHVYLYYLSSQAAINITLLVILWLEVAKLSGLAKMF